MKIKPNYFAGMNSATKITKVNGEEYTIRSNRHRFFFPDEWTSFYDALKTRQKITFNFLINTGASINEVRSIQVQDIDFDRNSIILRWTKGRNKDGSRKMRVISVSSQFIKWIKEIIKGLKPEDHFPILSTPAANIAMKKTLKETGVRDWIMFSTHNIRKTLEIWLKALGVDSLKIIKHFGLSNTITDTFNHEDKKNMRTIIGDIYSK